MDQFFPSEIARLVLGYLKEECPEAATMFQAKSLNLIEYRLLELQNKNPRTTVNGMTLINILNQRNTVVTDIRNKLKEPAQSQVVSNSDGLIKNLEAIIKAVSDNNPEFSVVYENISQTQNSAENGKEMKLNSNEENKADIFVKHENIKSEELTKEQENELIKIFRKTEYITHTERRNISKGLGISEMVIKLWFQTRRNEKRQSRRRRAYPYYSDNSDDPSYEPRPSTSRAADENDRNCSSSSQRKQSRSQ